MAIPDIATSGPVLVRLAREALGRHLGATSPAATPGPPWLAEPGACFVTLKDAQGELRGCVGSLAARDPVGEDVARNAIAAATRDTRFPPVTPGELPRLRLSVTLLRPPEPLGASSLDEACRKLRPGRDGVIVTCDRHRATYLPQVWDDLPEPRDFLASLWRKASLPPGTWPDGLRLERYDAISWSEPTP